MLITYMLTIITCLLSLIQAYYLRGLFAIRRPSMVPDERGCILMRPAPAPPAPASGGWAAGSDAAGDGPWRGYRLTAGGFAPLRAFPDRPGRSEIGGLPW